MKSFIFVLSCFLILCTGVHAQVFPKEGRKLHYRIIGFSFPESKGAVSYTIEIARGNIYSVDSFKTNIIATPGGRDNKITAEVPAFGAMYTWRVVSVNSKSTKSFSPLYHFSTLSIPQVDTNEYRLRVIKPATVYNEAFVFIDGHGVLYDMKGNPVWFVPDIDGSIYQNVQLRDIKPTTAGTITFILNGLVYEISYDGEILWKGPDNLSGGNAEQYHHEFTRLKNGHYMVLGNEDVEWRGAAVKQAASGRPMPNAQVVTEASNRKTNFGTVIEYDEHGNVKWQWKSSAYFMGSDLENYIPPNKAGILDVHQNAFFMDEKDSVIYVSFRNISRIVKVKYPGGNVLGAYGVKYTQGGQRQGAVQFCEQHSCRRSTEGLVYMFNNNVCNDSASLPNVIMLKESADVRDSLLLVWQYDCTADEVHVNPKVGMVKEKLQEARAKRAGMHLGNPIQRRPTSGGNVIELPDRSIFVAMNLQYGKVFIVSPGKQVLWNAIPEKFSVADRQWYVTPLQYRASIVTERKQLENMIWNRVIGE